jgi:reactive intermediate/imine deaminase
VICFGASICVPSRRGAFTLAGVKEVITRPDVPTPSLPFSMGIRANGFIFTAGQVGTDPVTGKVAGPDVASQTRQTIANLQAILEAGGSSLDKLVKTTVFLADLRTFEEMNAVYRELIPEPRPGRSTIEARLARPEILVEIEGIAVAD